MQKAVKIILSSVFIALCFKSRLIYIFSPLLVTFTPSFLFITLIDNDYNVVIVSDTKKISCLNWAEI